MNRNQIMDGKVIGVYKDIYDEGYTICGIKGKQNFERCGSFGHFNGYGGFRVYGKRYTQIKIRVFINCKRYPVNIFVRQEILDHYEKMRITDKLIERVKDSLMGENVEVYYNTHDKKLKIKDLEEHLN